MTTGSKLGYSIFCALKLVDEIYDKITIRLLPGGVRVKVGYPNQNQISEYINYDEFEELIKNGQLQDRLESVIRRLHQKKIEETIASNMKNRAREIQ